MTLLWAGGGLEVLHRSLTISQIFCDTLSIISRISSAAKFSAQKHNFFKNKTPLLHIIYLIFSLVRPENRNLPEKFIQKFFPHTLRTLSLKTVKVNSRHSWCHSPLHSSPFQESTAKVYLDHHLQSFKNHLTSLHRNTHQY